MYSALHICKLLTQNYRSPNLIFLPASPHHRPFNLAAQPPSLPETARHQRPTTNEVDDDEAARAPEVITLRSSLLQRVAELHDLRSRSLRLPPRFAAYPEVNSLDKCRIPKSSKYHVLEVEMFILAGRNSLVARSSELVQPPFRYIQRNNYVNVYMKWKKDAYYDSIEHIHRSIELKPIVSIKNFISQQANGCVPISAVSKIGLKFGIPIKVARFLRQYPAIFKEFTGPSSNVPWFRLTSNAASIDREEKKVYEEYKEDLRDRLKRFILMSKEKVLPIKIIQGLLWNLGLPECFMQNLDVKFDESFRFVKMEDGLLGLAVECEGKFLSVMQKKAMKRGIYSGGSMEAIEFPLFPSEGLRLRTKIKDWLSDFQKLPYICPFDDFSHLDTDSDLAEKRVIGVLHELLYLFVEQAAERKMVLCLKKYFGLPQKVHKAFERHPHMFYLSFRNKTCTVILKEAYQDDLTLERHPLLEVRKKYISLIKESEVMLRNKRIKQGNIDLDLSSESGSTLNREKEGS